MDLKEFLIHIPHIDSSEVTVYYKNAKYSHASEPSIDDIIDEMLFDAEAFGDLELFLEIPSKGVFYKKTLSTTEVTPLTIPDLDSPSLPDVRISFNLTSFAPEQLILEEEYVLPVINWLSVSKTIPSQCSSIDSSYGIPFGAYKLEIGLPELPSLKKRTSEIIVTIDADMNMNLSLLRSGRFLWNYSRHSFSVKWIEPIAYKAFMMIKKQIDARNEAKIHDAITKEFASATSFEDISFPTPQIKPPLDDSEFQIQRNMASYRYLYFVENSIRQFLWDKLKLIYKENMQGPRWWMGFFPEDIRNHIKDKMSTGNPILDNLKVETTPLHYCSFNELGQIAEKEWQKIFRERSLDRAPFFGHLSYLENLRNAIAHNRPLSVAELSILYENGKSLLGMLGMPTPRTTYRDILGEHSI